MPYDPENPMQDRITDIGPPHYEQFFPPVIKENYGKWVHHEILVSHLKILFRVPGSKGPCCLHRSTPS